MCSNAYMKIGGITSPSSYMDGGFLYFIKRDHGEDEKSTDIEIATESFRRVKGNGFLIWKCISELLRLKIKVGLPGDARYSAGVQ